jgi:hypothetical protein
MRRMLFPVAIVPILLLAIAAPVAAAPPLKESGTQVSLFSVSTSCGGSFCTDTVLDAFTIDSETLLVCVNWYTYSIRTGQLRSQEGGCTETSPDALTITESFNVTLSDTTVVIVECNRRGCMETGSVTVSASDSAVSPIFTDSSRGTFSDGECTYRYRSESTSAQVAGTMTIDGVVYEQQFGSASVSSFTVTSRCG